ncbi:MAG: hypothetical protein KAI81_01070 [Candidatus Marinimicrobia bacterium]|nr:hypothetical protein [Candidatus Neomarinimicrobiota bacterium]
MGFSRYFQKDHNFMFTKISGEINDDNLMDHVLALNKKTDGITNLKELADCREITSMEKLTVQGIVRCSQSETNRPESLLALLVTDSTFLYGMARAYQTFSIDRRKAVMIFKNINEALIWLANDDREVEVLKDFVHDNAWMKS